MELNEEARQIAHGNNDARYLCVAATPIASEDLPWGQEVLLFARGSRDRAIEWLYSPRYQTKQTQSGINGNQQDVEVTYIDALKTW